MAELENNMEFSGKAKSFFSSSSSFFNRSLTLHAASVDSNPKPHLSPSLNRTTSITKYYNPMPTVSNSIRGKVKNLCRLFESSKSSKSNKESQSPAQSPQTKLKSTKSSDLRVLSFSSFSSPAIRLPGTEDRIVVYFTSLRGIRRTFEDCYSVRMIFRGFRVWIDERDISMDSAYRKELQSVLGEKNPSLPQVFIRGQHVGGADAIKSMFEIGELAKILEGFPVREPGFVCQSCGDVRFMPCWNCSGSKKVFDEDDDVLKRCPECNENGLIRCPDCCS